MSAGGDSLAPEPVGELRERAAAVRVLALDVDGVLTDGTVFYGEHGETLKAFNILDGLGLRLLREAGLATAIISARDSPPLRRRASDLAIDHVFLGCDDKAAAWDELLARTGLPSTEAAFVGDDLIDLALLARAGFAVAVANAHPAVQRRAHYVTRQRGGAGAVREVADLLLSARGILQEAIARYASR